MIESRPVEVAFDSRRGGDRRGFCSRPRPPAHEFRDAAIKTVAGNGQRSIHPSSAEVGPQTDPDQL